MLWVFYTSKILDFFDTIIMVARGTWRQFSFLHVYHHTSIFMIYWLNLNSGYARTAPPLFRQETYKLIVK